MVHGTLLVESNTNSKGMRHTCEQHEGDIGSWGSCTNTSTKWKKLWNLAYPNGIYAEQQFFRWVIPTKDAWQQNYTTTGLDWLHHGMMSKCRWSVLDTAVDVVTTVHWHRVVNESTADSNVGLEQAPCFSVQADGAGLTCHSKLPKNRNRFNARWFLVVFLSWEEGWR